MTHVDFYHGAPDKLAAACELVGKAYRAGHTVLVYAPDATLAQRFDRLLWSQPSTAFVPHCAPDSPLAGETPVHIAASLEASPHTEVLVNLDGDLPPGFARFERLIEIVSQDEADRAPARSRYKFYRDRGYPLDSRQLDAA